MYNEINIEQFLAHAASAEVHQEDDDNDGENNVDDDDDADDALQVAI